MQLFWINCKVSTTCFLFVILNISFSTNTYNIHNSVGNPLLKEHISSDCNYFYDCLIRKYIFLNIYKIH